MLNCSVEPARASIFSADLTTNLHNPAISGFSTDTKAVCWFGQIKFAYARLQSVYSILGDLIAGCS
jgi:PPE-repeat protein